MSEHLSPAAGRRLYAVATEITAAATPAQVAQIVLPAALELAPATAGVLVALEASGGGVWLVGASGALPSPLVAWSRLPGEPAAAARPPGRGNDPLALALRTGRPSGPSGPSGHSGEAGTVSAWPLLLNGRPAGVLGLAGVAPHAPSAPTGDSQSVLPLLAQLSVLALERVRLQASLQNAARAQDAFLSTAAHELRTPLTSLRGFAQLLLRQLRRTGGVEPRRLTLALQRIEEQTEKLTHLVSRQLDRGRLDDGDLVLDLAVADVVPLLRHVVDTTTAGEGGSQITLRAPQTLLARVDTQRFEQALRGLLTRAVQVSPAGAPVEVVLEPVGDTALRLTVTDHGLPAPEGGAAGLPDPWLNASRQLVELHGGTLDAKTVETVERKDDQQGKAGKAGQTSKGTRVTVRLPLS